MPVLGAHVDSSGGLHLAFERAKAMGAESIQIHPTPPGFWGSPKLDENRIATFKEAAAKHGHPPFYFHAVYLINLAGDDPTLRQRSESTLAGYLKRAGEAAKPLTRGTMKKHLAVTVGALIAGEVIQHLPVPKKAKRLARVASALVTLAGGFSLRWAMVQGGREAANDPRLARLATSKRKEVGESQTLQSIKERKENQI